MSVQHGTAIDHGRALFSDPSASDSPSNAFSCATCHAATGQSSRILAGGSLAGVTGRASFWGGARQDLLAAIEDCRTNFMDAETRWTASNEDARAMYAYLESSPGDSHAVPFTVARAEPDLPAGDPSQGESIYANACAECHGEVHDGRGAIVSFAPTLPDEVATAHASFDGTTLRMVFLRKIREGAFEQGTGSMPPFSREALSDDQVASLLAFLDLY